MNLIISISRNTGKQSWKWACTLLDILSMRLIHLRNFYNTLKFNNTILPVLFIFRIILWFLLVNEWYCYQLLSSVGESNTYEQMSTFVTNHPGKLLFATSKTGDSGIKFRLTQFLLILPMHGPHGRLPHIPVYVKVVRINRLILEVSYFAIKNLGYKLHFSRRFDYFLGINILLPNKQSPITWVY